MEAHESDPLLYLQVINTKLIKDKPNLKNGTSLLYCNAISCYNIIFAHWNGARIEKDKLEKHIIFTKLERNTKLHKFFGQSDILFYRLALLTFCGLQDQMKGNPTRNTADELLQSVSNFIFRLIISKHYRYRSRGLRGVKRSD